MNKFLLLGALALIALGGCSKIDLQPQNAESTHTHTQVTKSLMC